MSFQATTTHGEHRFRTLLSGYISKSESIRSASDASVRDLLLQLPVKLRAWRKSEEKSASDFNLLNTLDITGNEIRHSMMLAWLLDHRIERAGTHAQGGLGFQLFLAELGLDESYAEDDYWVSREVCGDESRVDIEIAAPQRFVVHIENKIHSLEGDAQTVI